MEHPQTALVIGNSSGIGLELTRLILARGLQVVGLSKSPSSVVDSSYRHVLLDVTDPDFEASFSELVGSLGRIDLCVYCAGIGDRMKLSDLDFETKVVRVNFMSAVVATNVVLSKMMAQGAGHFIGLSSLADCLTSPESPSYAASKAGVSRYWECMGLAVAERGIDVSNVRFGFVDTKLSKSTFRPMLIDAKSAAAFIEDVIARPRIRASKPLLISLLASISGTLSRLRFFCR